MADTKNGIASEIKRLHDELIIKGRPAKAKIFKRFGRGRNAVDDNTNFFMNLEVDVGDGKSYRVTKYRPWLPFRVLNTKYEDEDRKPYYWHIDYEVQDQFKEGETLHHSRSPGYSGFDRL